MPLNFCNFRTFPEKKLPKFGTKLALLDNFEKKISYLGKIGLEFQKNIVIFEISTLKFDYWQNFAKRPKCLNLRQKISVFRIFGLEV